jgi:hypothetical protein
MRKVLIALCLSLALPAYAETVYQSPAGQTDANGRLFVRDYGIDPAFVTTLVTVATLWEFIPAPAAGKSIHITDITYSASGATTATTDQQNLLKYGTGTNCATGTTLLWGAQGAALATITKRFTVPLKVPAAKAVCYMNAAAGTKIISLNYFVAP